MSLITRCPACGTMFKVVPDQLRISEGWVRCGHCAEVFDASAHLQSDVALAPPANEGPEPELGDELPAPHQRAVPRDEPATDETPASNQAPAEQAEPEEFASSLNTVVDDEPDLDSPDTTQLEAEAQSLRETPMDRPFELRREDIEEEIAEPLPKRFTPIPNSELEPELDDLAFVRQARSKEFWSRPGARVALALLLVMLAVLLLIQVGVHDRDRLAAAHPGLRSSLARLCQPFRCRIVPPRQIEAIVIDSSSFNKLRGDAYRLNFTLRNQAANQVAMPALELTLTDGQDQPLVRRVLQPADLGTPSGVIDAMADWSGSVAMAFPANGNGSGARVAGYRLLAFYP